MTTDRFHAAREALAHFRALEYQVRLAQAALPDFPIDEHQLAEISCQVVRLEQYLVEHGLATDSTGGAIRPHTASCLAQLAGALAFETPQLFRCTCDSTSAPPKESSLPDEGALSRLLKADDARLRILSATCQGIPMAALAAGVIARLLALCDRALAADPAVDAVGTLQALAADADEIADLLGGAEALAGLVDNHRTLTGAFLELLHQARRVRDALARSRRIKATALFSDLDQAVAIAEHTARRLFWGGEESPAAPY